MKYDLSKLTNLQLVKLIREKLRKSQPKQKNEKKP